MPFRLTRGAAPITLPTDLGLLQATMPEDPPRVPKPSAPRSMRASFLLRLVISALVILGISGALVTVCMLIVDYLAGNPLP